MGLTFSKEEKLCSRSLIEKLYSEGHRLMAFPYSVQWRIIPESIPGAAPCQVLIVAPKRRFHHAVDRNRVKRLTRECWRLSKQPLCDTLSARGITLTLSLVYIHNEIMPYDKLLPRIGKLVQQLQKEFENEK